MGQCLPCGSFYSLRSTIQSMIRSVRAVAHIWTKARCKIRKVRNEVSVRCVRESSQTLARCEPADRCTSDVLDGISQHLFDVRVGIGDLSCGRIEDEYAVLGRLEQSTITDFRYTQLISLTQKIFERRAILRRSAFLVAVFLVTVDTMRRRTYCCLLPSAKPLTHPFHHYLIKETDMSLN